MISSKLFTSVQGFFKVF